MVEGGLTPSCTSSHPIGGISTPKQCGPCMILISYHSIFNPTFFFLICIAPTKRTSVKPRHNLLPSNEIPPFTSRLSW